MIGETRYRCTVATYRSLREVRSGEHREQEVKATNTLAPLPTSAVVAAVPWKTILRRLRAVFTHKILHQWI
jgi:hypothetical protein